MARNAASQGGCLRGPGVRRWKTTRTARFHGRKPSAVGECRENGNKITIDLTLGEGGGETNDQLRASIGSRLGPYGKCRLIGQRSHAQLCWSRGGRNGTLPACMPATVIALHLSLDGVSPVKTSCKNSAGLSMIFALAVVFGAVQPAAADWYSGDPYLAYPAWPQYTDNESDANQVLALTYDNLTWVPGAGAGVVESVGGNFWGSPNGLLIDTAYWEIRTGMSHNVAGTLVASGSGTVTPYATSFTQGGSSVWGVNVDVPNFTLPAGNYWFGLAVGSTNPSGIGWFVSSTTGTNGVGGPLGDDLSIYYQNSIFGLSWNYTESAIVNPTLSGFDPSYFIHEVPEPSTLALAALGLLSLGYATQRKKLQRA